MIISHSHKYIFIKSFKTAGTSLEAALSKHCTGEDIVTELKDYKFNRDENGDWIHRSHNPENFHQHDEALVIRDKLPKEVWDSYYKFSIARNPWDRAVSFFFWENRRDLELIPRKRFYHYLGVPFDELRDIRKRFADYIKGDWTNNDGFYTIDNELCVDFVIRYENIEEDVKKVCEAIGVPNIDLPRLKSGMRQQNYHYSEYYDDVTRQIVADRNQNDLRLFGYEFENARGDKR
jgi:isopentenyldiphosphate isomerase